MKQYYINYYNNFANTYNLFWAEGPEMIAKLPPNATRITRVEAIRKCQQERERAKYDSGFSGFADSQIFPAGAECQCYPNSPHYFLDGYIWKKS